MNMSTSSLILYRTFQVLGFILAIFKIFAPFIALYLLWRIARNLEKPPKLTEEVKIVRKSLSETLKENRTRCKMTQEFVAETIGVSRQAVSKWENGTSEPCHLQPDGAGKALRHPGRGSAQGRGKRTGSTGKIITTPPAAPPYPPRSAWGNGSCGLFHCGAL